MSDELQQQHTEAEKRAAAAAESTHRVEEWVRWLEQTHVDHVARVSDPQGRGAERGDTAEALEQIAHLQAQLPAPPGETHCTLCRRAWRSSGRSIWSCSRQH